MNILCLDLGTKTGWCLARGHTILGSGIENFKTDRFSSAGMRFLRFKNFLDEMINSLPSLEKVCYEEVRMHKGATDAHYYGGYWGTLTAWCEDRKIQYEGIPVGTIKKTVTGRGNANKIEMMEHIKARGHDVVDDNEADALGIFYTVTT